jgi:hypothetical protein
MAVVLRLLRLLRLASYFIFIFAGPKWVIGTDFRKRSFIASWSRRPPIQPRRPKRQQLPFGLFHNFIRPPLPERPRRDIVDSMCPLDVARPTNSHRSPFKVWDGYQFLHDTTFGIECSIERMEAVEGCCETVRVASSYTASLAMQHQKARMGLYKAVGKMNERLVYQQLDSLGYIYSWLNPFSFRHNW